MVTQSGKMEVLRPLGLRTERRILVYNQRTGGIMKVGDLVVSSISPETSEIGVIVGINKNGDCKVHFAHGVYLISTMWLEVI